MAGHAINMKVHNVFIAALGPDIQYYTALVRSLDSCRYMTLETIAPLSDNPLVSLPIMAA